MSPRALLQRLGLLRPDPSDGSRAARSQLLTSFRARLSALSVAALVAGAAACLAVQRLSAGAGAGPPLGTLVAVLGALAAVLVLVSFLVARRLHAGMRVQFLGLAHLANTVRSRRDFTIRGVERFDADFGMIVDAFNRLLVEIERRGKRLRSELKRSDLAREAKTQFLATMSHELRTPINGILGMTQLLQDTRLDDDQREYAQTLHRSAEGLLRIVNEVLDFSKGEAGRIELEEVVFLVEDVVKASLETVSAVASHKGLELERHIEPDAPRVLRGDPGRLRQVLLNLLNNALKFTDAGRITLRVAVEEEGECPTVRFEVQDTGIGIPEGRRNRLFQPFTQVDAAHSRTYGGTGLGLSICRQIVEAMGGRMFVESEEGTGSTFGFHLRLPLAEGGPGSPPPVTERRILVAEGDEANRALLRRLLDGNELMLVNDVELVRMALAGSGPNARPYDLVIGTFELLDAVRSDLGDVPRVVLAERSLLQSAAELAGERGSALVQPYGRDELYWCVEVLLAEVEQAPPPAPALPAPAGTTEEPAESQAATEASSGDAGPRVLVAEDNRVNQKIITRFLDKLGAAWFLASNGEEAVEAFASGDFDLVLMDIQMPVMDGIDATDAIRRMEKGRPTRVPIAAVTANVLEEDRRMYLSSGFDAHLPKPLRFEQFREFCESVLDGERDEQAA